MPQVTVKTGNTGNDIFYPGNYVVHSDGTVLLVTDQQPGEYFNSFGGVLISKGEGESREAGHFSMQWDKGSFTQFRGTITIDV